MGNSTLAFEAPAFDSRHGKGYGELLIVDRAVQSLAENAVVIKVTGRLIVDNFSELLPGIRRTRAVTADLLQGLRRADSRTISRKRPL